jgi:all-trans-retinol dehydrogenase (NAD+)
VRLELWRDGFSKIRTLLVCPNAVDTGMFHGIMEGANWTAWLSRLLLPTTREADAAARIVDAMANGEQLVVSCYTGWRRLIVPWLPSVARLLPVSWFDRVVYLGGGVHGMDTFVGRQKKEN